MPYDEAARVPLILRLPGVFEGGQVRKELISNVDLMPTILDIAGVVAPSNLQGMSLVPLGRGNVAGWRTLVCNTNGKNGDTRGIRTDRYKLILRQRAKEGAPGIYELYDLEKDPQERTNLFGKEQADVIRPILDQFETWTKATGDKAGLELASACRQSLDKNMEKTK